MKYPLKIIYGKEVVNKFLSEIPFTVEEKNINVKEYTFETKKEMDAFLKGVNETIGWTECFVLEN